MNRTNTKTVHILILMAGLSLGGYLMGHILIPATHSVSPKLFWRTNDTPATQNEYMLFELHDPYLPEGETHLVKRVGCMSGQFLSRLNLQFYCDGQEIAIAMTYDSSGKKLPIFSFNGVIPEGKAFAVGDTSNSYDSRYWGLVDINTAKRVSPIF